MTTEKTRVALRVLTAINDKRDADPKDVVLLRAYCPDGRADGPDGRELDPDEMACIVIQDALKAKREKRKHEREQSA